MAPSAHSASPTSTNTLYSFSNCFAYKAFPKAKGNAVPKLQELYSNPIFKFLGCPVKRPSLDSNFSNSHSGKKPISAIAGNSAKRACSFPATIRSRFSQRGLSIS